MEPTLIDTFSVFYENFDLYVTKYMENNSIALFITEEGTKDVYSMITVNLSEYGRTPANGSIFINHNIMGTSLYEFFKNKYADSVNEITYGYATSVEMNLNYDILEKIKVGLND